MKNIKINIFFFKHKHYLPCVDVLKSTAVIILKQMKYSLKIRKIKHTGK